MNIVGAEPVRCSLHVGFSNSTLSSETDSCRGGSADTANPCAAFLLSSKESAAADAKITGSVGDRPVPDQQLEATPGETHVTLDGKQQVSKAASAVQESMLLGLCAGRTGL